MTSQSPLLKAREALVKPLEWNVPNPDAIRGRIRSIGGIVNYTIAFVGVDDNAKPLYSWAGPGEPWNGPLDTFVAAQKAVQDDYATRILSALNLSQLDQAIAAEAGAPDLGKLNGSPLEALSDERLAEIGSGDDPLLSYMEKLSIARELQHARSASHLQTIDAGAGEPVAWMIRLPDGKMFWDDVCFWRSASDAEDGMDGWPVEERGTVIPIYAAPPVPAGHKLVPLEPTAGDLERETMWATVVVDEHTSRPVWDCHADRDEGGPLASVTLTAGAFAVGTRLSIVEPMDTDDEDDAASPTPANGGQ